MVRTLAGLHDQLQSLWAKRNEKALEYLHHLKEKRRSSAWANRLNEGSSDGEDTGRVKQVTAKESLEYLQYLK